MAFLEIFAASGLAFAQPMFDVLGRNSELFVGRNTTVIQLVALTIAVLVLPPVVLYGIEVLAGVVLPASRRYAHAVVIGIAAAVVAVEVSKHVTDLAFRMLLVAGAIGGIGMALLVLRVQFVRSWLRLLSAAPVVFAGLFVFSSSVTPVVLGDSTPGAMDIRVERPHRVVWIVFDELPLTSLLDGSGGVDAALFPNFAAMAATSNWYRNSTTIAPFTLAALPGMLTGNYPENDTTAAITANYPDNIFTLLGGSYRVNARETLTVLCPSGVCADSAHRAPRAPGLVNLASDSLDLWREFASPRRKAPGLDAVRGVLSYDSDPRATAQQFVASLAPTETPMLDFLHLLLPHWPWRYVQSMQNTGDVATPPGLVGDRWTTPWATTAARERHLLQVQATDTVLGLVRERLRAIGAWDDSLVVVTADHGVGFVAGAPLRGLSNAGAADVVWTPLFVKLPGQDSGRVDDRPARSVDILPTIADAIGAPIPWPVSGRSLLGPRRRDGPIRVMHWPPKHGQFDVVDGPSGFEAVLRGRAAGSGGDPALRIYRTGPYGALVGSPAADLIRSGTSTAALTVNDPARFASVVPDAGDAPWLTISGAAVPRRGGVNIAVAVNGIVAAVTQSVPVHASAFASWWASLPPQLFRAGANDVRLFEIQGGPSTPTLRPFAAGPRS